MCIRDRCNKTGYRGRTGIFEYLEVNDPIREMISQNTGGVAFRRKCIELGMEPLAQNGLNRVKDGTTTIEEVMGVCVGD